MNPTTNTSPNLWPYAIIAWFVLFALALAVWVTVALRQNMDLVRSDYYEEEMRFQQHLDRLNRSAGLQSRVTLGYDPGPRLVTLRLPATAVASPTTGRIQFYRPSNAALDFELPLAVDAAGVQQLDVSSVRGGQWRVRVTWSAVPGAARYRVYRDGAAIAEVMTTIRDLGERGIVLRSLREGIDTSNASGRMVAGVLASLAELELELGRERRAAARDARRARGQSIGRPKALDASKAALVQRMHASGESATTIATTLGVSRATIYRVLADTDSAD